MLKHNDKVTVNTLFPVSYTHLYTKDLVTFIKFRNTREKHFCVCIRRSISSIVDCLSAVPTEYHILFGTGIGDLSEIYNSSTTSRELLPIYSKLF